MNMKEICTKNIFNANCLILDSLDCCLKQKVPLYCVGFCVCSNIENGSSRLDYVESKIIEFDKETSFRNQIQDSTHLGLCHLHINAIRECQVDSKCSGIFQCYVYKWTCRYIIVFV